MILRMTQWHPIFAEVLRPSVAAPYDLRTTVPVGDLPREADFLVLRRKRSAPGPYRGLWRRLTVVNVFEFKGPTVATRRADLELLVELGLGIGRRLHTGRGALWPRVPASETSFWYLANRLGRPLLREAARQLRGWQVLGPGLWRGEVLGHPVFLVSGVELPVDEDSLPLHIVGRESPEQEREVVRLVAERTDLTKTYGGWLASLHPEAWKEYEIMAR